MAKVNSVNVRQIAEKAGVSHITVSRALRGGTNVSQKTRDKVLKVAKELGYQNNPLVQAYTAHIRRKGGEMPSCNIAWMRSFGPGEGKLKLWQRPYFEGAQERARELGFSLDNSINAYDMTDEQVDRVLKARNIRGVLMPFMDFFHREPYQREHLVTVGVGESPSETPMHTVIPDHFKNVTTAVDRLLAYGYKRIGFCEHDYSTVLSQGVLWGSYHFNSMRLGMEKIIPPLTGFSLDKDSEKNFINWIQAYRPDAVIVTIFHARKWLEEAKLEIPKDVALVHLGMTDDVKNWSGVDYNPKLIGAAAVDMLSAHQLRNEYGIPETPKVMHIGGQWVDGKTTVRPQKRIKAFLPPSQSHSMEWFDQEFWGRETPPWIPPQWKGKKSLSDRRGLIRQEYVS